MTTAVITELLRRSLHIEVPSPDTDLLETGLLDSLGLVDLLLHLEQRFGIEIPLDELEFEHFQSVASIARLVEGRQKAA